MATNTVTYQANGVVAFGTADAAVTAATSLTNGAAVVKADPYAGTEYGSNSVWSQTALTTARTTAAQAIADGVYTQWTVSRTGGLLPKAIRVKVARGALGTSVRGFRIRWSVDNYATDLLGRDTALTSAETRPNLVQHPGAGDPLQGDLSATPSQTSITFRLYNYATAANNSLEFDDLELTYDTPAATITGTGALAATGGALSGAGTVRITGAGNLAPAPPTLASTGTLRLTGSGALTATAPTISGAGTVTAPGVGTGALTAASPTLSGTGVIRITGTGSITATAPSLAAAGVIRINGGGALNAQAPTLAGSGTSSAPTPVDVVTHTYAQATLVDTRGEATLTGPAPSIATLAGNGTSTATLAIASGQSTLDTN